MQKLTRSLVRAGGAILIALSAAGSGRAADVAIVTVPQGMILEMRLARANATPEIPGRAVGLVVARDLRVGNYVVIAAGSRGVGHLVMAAHGSRATAAAHGSRATAAAHGSRATTAARVAYDYVVASDGTRIPVAGTLPYLTTSVSRPVVIYTPGERFDDSAVPVRTLTDAPLARP